MIRSLGSDLEYKTYQSFTASSAKVRESLKRAIDSDEARKNTPDAVSQRKVISLYNRAINDMVAALSIKPSSCPVNKRDEVIEAQTRIQKFLDDTQDRALKLEFESSRPNAAGSSTVHVVPPKSLNGPSAAMRSATSKFDKLKDKSIMLRNVNSKFGDEILSTIVSETNARLSSINGNEAAKKALEESVILPSINPTLFTGLRAPCKGILLFGPPGNGKTLIAKAVANECGSTFFSISAATIMSKWVGDGERLVQALFQIARNAQPSIIFIDEIDSMLCERSENEQGAARRVKTEFLIQLDGCAGRDEDRVLVLGATNRPHELDEGILRRFPRRIFIDLPDENGRFEMLKATFQRDNTKIQMNDRDFSKIAKLTDGYSYSDLMGLARTASLISVQEIDKNELQNVSAKNLRPVNLTDMCAALNNSRPSINVDNRKKLVEFAQKYAQI